MTEKAPERLLELQRRFAGHLRDPDNIPPPEGIEDRRLAIYRRLFFNNLSNLFSRNFPVIRKLHDDAGWKTIIRAFLVQHRSNTPMFTEIGGEFVEFLNQRMEDDVVQQPWLAELAHWEYLETCVRLDGAEVEHPTSKGSTPSAERLLDKNPRLNPTLKLAQYQWPVHRISPSFLPAKTEPVILAVYRHRNDRVGFMQINELTGALLQALEPEDAPNLAEVLKSLAAQVQQPVESLVQAALPLIGTLLERELILGTRSTSTHPSGG